MKQNRKIDFVIIGAMKAGTTAISNYLNIHPSISIHDDKEPNLFSQHEDWRSHFEKYTTHFDEQATLWGDASTEYSKYPQSPRKTAARLADHNAALKIIYIIRNPIERIISDYMHLRMRGYTKLDINTAVKEVSGLIDRSRYATQIGLYEVVFPTDQILVLTYEDFKRDNQGILDRIYSFLNIASEPIQHEIINPSIENKKYLAKYDTLRNSFPNWLRKLIPASIRDILRGKIQGPTFSEKPQLSAENEAYIRSELKDEIAIMATKYGTTKYF